jgi:shikimate kinase
MPPASTAPRRKLICLIGFMGCGKTTIGLLLAQQLAWRFVDLDTRIVEHAGLTITEIFDRLGEPAFREIEHERLLRALGEAAEQDASTVLALGGGTFAQPRNVELLRRGNAVVIWLDCSIEILLQRCVMMVDRPLFRDEAGFRTLYEQRRPFYQQADYRVEGEAQPHRVVEQILALGFLERPVGVAEPRGALKDDAGRGNA